MPDAHTRFGCGVSTVSTDNPDPRAFVALVAEKAAEIGAGYALFFFSQALMSAEDLADAIAERLPALPHAGCSTAGELTSRGLEEAHAVAILFPSASFRIASAMVPEISRSPLKTITATVGDLRSAIGNAANGRPSRVTRGGVFAFCLIDGLCNAEEAISSAIYWALDDIPLIGGSAGDDLNFNKTTLIHNGEVGSDSVIVALVETDVPFQAFKADNFVATGNRLVVTASDPGRRIVHEFNAANAANEYAEAVGVMSAELTPLSFASHPVVVRVGGEYYCRSIQRVHDDGSLSFFCAIDDGIVLSTAEATELVASTRQALDDVGEKLDGVDFILGFDCVLRRLDAQNQQVLREMSELYRTNRVVGFGTYGEQYRSMHLNQTLTGVAFGRRADASP